MELTRPQVSLWDFLSDMHIKSVVVSSFRRLHELAGQIGIIALVTEFHQAPRESPEILGIVRAVREPGRFVAISPFVFTVARNQPA